MFYGYILCSDKFDCCSSCLKCVGAFYVLLLLLRYNVVRMICYRLSFIYGLFLLSHVVFPMWFQRLFICLPVLRLPCVVVCSDVRLLCCLMLFEWWILLLFIELHIKARILLFDYANKAIWIFCVPDVLSFLKLAKLKNVKHCLSLLSNGSTCCSVVVLFAGFV